MNLGRIAHVLGINVMLQAATMLLAIPIAIMYAELRMILVFIESSLIVAAVGGALYFIGRKASPNIFRREALAIVGFSWIFAGVMGAVPFYLGGLSDKLSDCIFEAMSGLTTTGASILSDIEAQPKALLYWRSFLHFMGGIGIVVLFVAVLPALGGSGKAMFKQEVTGPVPEGLTPRIKDTAKNLFRLYIALNFICFVFYMLAGMNFFDALNHAMSTVATGGFSTSNTSVEGYGAFAEWVAITFMFICGASFMLHLTSIDGRTIKPYFKSTEFKTYGIVVITFAFAIAVALYITGAEAVSKAGWFNFRDSLFVTLAIITTTGFGVVDYDTWPEFVRYIILVMMFFGGMAGSTAGGMKIIRLFILHRIAVLQLSAEASPHEVRTLRVDGRLIDRRVMTEILVFFFVYLAVFGTGALFVVISMPHQDLLSSISAVASCLNNVGPGLGEVGPTMNYGGQSDAAKYILSFMMVLGRLELFVVLILFMPRFWLSR